MGQRERRLRESCEIVGFFFLILPTKPSVPCIIKVYLFNLISFPDFGPYQAMFRAVSKKRKKNH